MTKREIEPGVEIIEMTAGQSAALLGEALDEMPEARVVPQGDYEPELGQMVFGNPWSGYDLDEQCPEAGELLCCISWLLAEDENYGYGTEYVSDNLEMHRYWWGDDEAPEAARPNFRYGEVEIRWYKYIGRGMTTNVEKSAREWIALFAECVTEVLKQQNATEEQAGDAAGSSATGSATGAAGDVADLAPAT